MWLDLVLTEYETWSEMVQGEPQIKEQPLNNQNTKPLHV